MTRLVAAAALLSACVVPPVSEDLDGGARGSGPPIGVPPLLGYDTHPGWRNAHCENCHALPVEGHTVTERYVCAQCHGANGACETNLKAKTDHQPTDDCAACHTDATTGRPGNHGFTSSAVCANCHFRGLGQSRCASIVVIDAGTPPPPDGGAPTLDTNLVTNCFNFPAVPFSKTNSVVDGQEWNTRLVAGQRAVDFTLKDTAGQSHTLSKLLENGPVWLQTGSYSCPVYEGAVARGLNPLSASSNAKGPYTQQVQFVHVYVVEAHPKSPPDWSPYNSTRQFQWSTVAQPTTYAARLSNAKLVEPAVNNELMLVDSLDGSGGSNAVWCTYGTCPACSFLIGRDGVIRAAFRTSENVSELKPALDAFLATQ